MENNPKLSDDSQLLLWACIMIALLLVLGGCAAQVSITPVKLSTGKIVDYVHGRTDSQGGVEVAYVSIWQGDTLVANHHGFGSTLAGLLGSEAIKVAGMAMLGAGLSGISLGSQEVNQVVNQKAYRVGHHHRCLTCNW